ncbi:hypothetical protein ACFLXQ_00320 [Chloroflexota bacterium]
MAGYWLLPISGRVIVITEEDAAWPWPQIVMQPVSPQPGEKVSVWVTDTTPWPHVQLAVDGIPAHFDTWQANADGTWTWVWTFATPDKSHYSLIFYHDCHTGCQRRGQVAVGVEPPAPSVDLTPTKLGVVFANPNRDWHNRQGWAVELTYARPMDDTAWGIDDLAGRVHQNVTNGLRVLVRVDYAPGQSLPPANDHLALTEYLAYIQRLARDDRLQNVYGYLIGSGFNALDSNRTDPQHPVTPAWYARVFNGYGRPVSHTDNVVQVIRAENPNVRILVGPVQPWNSDQDGEQPYNIDAPWLNYMHTLVAFLAESTQVKAAAGIPLAGPDGFAVQAPGRPTAPEVGAQSGADEPRLDLPRETWNDAQAGFGVYRDWLAIINSFPITQGLPVYISSSNTFTPDDGIPPAQNYPRGWLTTALSVVNQEPQVMALCWFMDDLPGDTQWLWFSLTQQSGRLMDAGEEFDALLQNKP